MTTLLSHRARRALTTAIALGLGSWNSSSIAAPDDAPQDPVALFKKLDINRDNRLSRKEVEGTVPLSARFDEFDQNSDGYWSVEEYMAAFKAIYQNEQGG